jgi:hypothetical protein
MRFLVDEDVPMDVDRALRQHGFGTVRVAEVLGFQTDKSTWHPRLSQFVGVAGGSNQDC